jgi:hypothetical protein
MTDYKTVFTSLLALDAYHRSLNQGVFHKRADGDFDYLTSKDAVGLDVLGGGAITQFGDASVYFTAFDAATSFHAVAYKLADGSIVVSYRGTDAIGEGVSDVQHGWMVGAGFETGNQATKADALT